MNGKMRLLRNFILVSVPLFTAMVFTFLSPMYYMTEEYVLWREEKDYVNRKAAPSDLLILGDSRSKSSVIPAKLSYDGSIYNIGIGGATSIEMYYAAKNYMKNHGAVKEAVIIFAPYHFCDIDNWDQTLFNNYLSVGELSEVYSVAAKYGDDVILRNGWFTEELSFRLRLPTKYLSQMYDARFVGFYDRNKARYESARSEYGYCEFGKDPGNDGVNYEVHHETFDASPVVLDYYERLIDELLRSGADVKIVQAPINETSDAAMHEEFMRGYEDYLNKLKEKYSDVYIMTDVPVYENRYFGDNNHLNRSGAEVYTKWLGDALKNGGLDL